MHVTYLISKARRRGNRLEVIRINKQNLDSEDPIVKRTAEDAYVKKQIYKYSNPNDRNLLYRTIYGDRLTTTQDFRQNIEKSSTVVNKMEIDDLIDGTDKKQLKSIKFMKDK